MLKEFSDVVLDIYRGAREQPVDDFQDWAFERIKSVLPFDSALWLSGTLVDGEATFHSQLLHKQPPQLLADWARCQDKAVFAEKVFGAPGTTFSCVTSRDLGPELAEHSRRYNIEHILATASINPVAQLHELISIYRADLDKPFSEEERLFQKNLMPHLDETSRINRISHMNKASQPRCAADSRSAVTDLKGTLHLIDPDFACLLLDEWPSWRGPRLPDEVVAKIESPDKQFVGKTLAIHFSSLNDLLMLRGRRKSRVDALSQREQVVAKHYSDGRTYKEIAKLLELSPATVRNYLNTVYRKMGVGNKADFVNLFREHN